MDDVIQPLLYSALYLYKGLSPLLEWEHNSGGEKNDFTIDHTG